MSYDAFCNSPPARVTEVFSLRHGEKWSVNRAVKNNGSLSKSKWWLFFFYYSPLISYNITKDDVIFFCLVTRKACSFILLKKKKMDFFLYCFVLVDRRATHLQWLLSCKNLCSVSSRVLFFFSFSLLSTMEIGLYSVLLLPMCDLLDQYNCKNHKGFTGI